MSYVRVQAGHGSAAGRDVSRIGQVLVQSLFLCLIVVISSECRGQDREIENAGSQDLVDDILSATNEIRTYSVKSTVRIRPPFMPPEATDEDREQEIVSTSSILGRSGERLRIDMTVSPPPGIPLPEMRWLVVFDGTWQWLETTHQGATNVSKVRIERVSPNPDEAPFNTGVFVSGLGLIAAEDLPGTVRSLLTIYQVRQLAPDDKRVPEGQRVLVGNVDERRFKEWLQRTGQTANGAAAAMGQRMQAWGMFYFSKENHRLLGYRVGESEDKITTIVEFEYQNVNHELPEDAFEYEPDEGVEVHDITEDVVATRGLE